MDSAKMFPGRRNFARETCSHSCNLPHVILRTPKTNSDDVKKAR